MLNLFKVVFLFMCVLLDFILFLCGCCDLFRVDFSSKCGHLHLLVFLVISISLLSFLILWQNVVFWMFRCLYNLFTSTVDLCCVVMVFLFVNRNSETWCFLVSFWLHFFNCLCSALDCGDSQCFIVLWLCDNFFVASMSLRQ